MTHRKRTRAQLTFRDPRNVITKERLRRELVAPTDELLDFTYHQLVYQSDGIRKSTHLEGMRRALIAGLERHLQYVACDPAVEQRALPQDMGEALLQALRLVTRGESAPLFTPNVLPGGRGNRRKALEQQSVDWAVHYITAARMHWLSDATPVRTVARAYQVSSRQVARWLAAAGKPRAREVATKNWAHSLGLRPYSDQRAGRAAENLLGSMAYHYQLAGDDNVP